MQDIKPTHKPIKTFYAELKQFEAGKRLAHIHVHYEDQPPYKLELSETPNMPLDWRVERMRFSKDKTQIRYNDFLTLNGIPTEVLGYRLGNRSALEWVVDQYRIENR